MSCLTSCQTIKNYKFLQKFQIRVEKFGRPFQQNWTFAIVVKKYAKIDTKVF